MSTSITYDSRITARHQAIQDLISAKLDLIGYIYPHAPLELFLAHNLTPTLLWADPQIPGAYESSLQTFCCAYSRNLFSQRSKERLPPLKGIVFPGGTCDSLQNLGDVWRARFPNDIILRLTYPVANDGAATTYLSEELRDLNKLLEIRLGTRFSMAKYQQAVALIAEFRAASQFITAARILQPLLYPYLEYTRLVRHFLTAPNVQNLQAIEDIASHLQDELRKTQQLPTVEALRYGLLTGNLPEHIDIHTKDEPRIMIMGGMVDPEGIAIHFNNAKTNANLDDVEITFDLLSFTFRTTFAKAPNLQGDPFNEMAQSILSAPSEPTQEGLPDRLEFTNQIFDRLKISGLIVCEQSFCDPDQFEVPDVLKLAEKKKILTVRVPLDPEFSDRARLEGRLQSFLETLTAR
jgi:benzoyl-CoA reductase/2-hydroxyglutaryl-CoA dehydratase subunit BcrC/BadD/HgdB